jgi:hypothetical protein
MKPKLDAKRSLVRARPGKLRAIYVGVLVLALAIPQAWAQVEQVRTGYRPFVTSPTRVSYSWDMFSTAVERCDVHWDPPLQVEGRPVSAMSDRSAPVEFDTVYDDRKDYRAFAFDACASFGRPATTVTMRCALPNGTVEETHEPCP